MSNPSRKVIVPFFIAHRGCPHQCVFCDQRRISGADGRLPGQLEILEQVRRFRESSGRSSVEIAFYGGSFTLLSISHQRSLLEPLQPLLDSGEVSSIRLSTRPDAVTVDDITLLRQYRVSLVELGIQSMDDTVLAASGRGHTAADAVRACSLLRGAGIAVGAQLMPGLPGDTFAGALRSLWGVLALKPACLRVYPTLVLEGTELAGQYRRGEYTPLSLDEAVTLGARHLHAALKAEVPLIRMGLQATELLAGPYGVIAGPHHPAFRSLAESKLMLDLILQLVGNGRGPATVAAHPARRAAVAGQNGRNRERLRERGVNLQKILPDSTLSPHDLAVTINGVTCKGTLVTDLQYSETEAYHA